MLKSKKAWIFINMVILAFWLAVLVLIALGQTHTRFMIIAAIVGIAHVLELPVAFRVLKGRGVPAWKATLMTMLFGFTWWLPVRRNIYAA